MARCQPAGVIVLLTLVTALPPQQTADIPPLTSYVPQQLSAVPQLQQASPADQLSALIGPAVEAAVWRAQSGWRLGQLAGRLGQLTGRLEQLHTGTEDGRRALVELTRQQGQLDTIADDLSGLRQAVTAGGGGGGGSSADSLPGDVCKPPQPGHQPETRQDQESESSRRQTPPSSQEPESRLGSDQRGGAESGLRTDQEPPVSPKPACESHPAPLPADAATYRAPAVRACARSCLQLRNQNSTGRDGVYWLTGLPVPVLCDFSHDGGGWTLLLTAVSRAGWDPLSVLGRRKLAPSLTADYSILRYGDTLRDLGTGGRFAYRIETQAEKGRQRWGGIWFAPRRYSFTDETATQTDVSLVRRFDNWVYKTEGIKQRMPWINTGGHHAMLPILTTSGSKDPNWWGTLVTHLSHPTHNHSPWMNTEGFHSGNVLYWIREDIL